MDRRSVARPPDALDDSPTPDQWPTAIAAIRECSAKWELKLGERYGAGAGGHTVRAERRDGTAAVLKVIFHHREAEHEPDALAVWNGDGAVRLLERDDVLHAILIERCEPGTELSERDPDDALGVLIGLLPRLWRPAGPPFRTLADEVAWWLSYLENEWIRFGKPFERRILDAAVELLSELPKNQGEQVLLNQDLHSGNVLAAQREPWLVIDPKPLVGEREFGLAPIVRAFEISHGKRYMLRCLDRLSDELTLDRERARLWTIGQTVAWSFDSQYPAETARWLLEA